MKKLLWVLNELDDMNLGYEIINESNQIRLCLIEDGELQFIDIVISYYEQVTLVYHESSTDLDILERVCSMDCFDKEVALKG